MSKAVKILSAIGVLLVALVVAGIAILKSIDFNQYKDVIAEQAKAATGRELTIAGDLSLSLSLSPRVSVQGVTFANAPWGSDPVMLSVKRFAAEMSLIPLLSGEIEIKQVILEGVNVLAEKDKSGQANWDFGPPAPANQAPAASTSEADVVLPVINNVSLKDVNVTYKDAQAGLEYSLNLGTVDLKSGGLDAPLDLVILGAVNDQAFAIKGQLGSIGAIGGGEIIPVKLNIAALKMDVGLDGKIGVPNGNPMVDLRLKVDGNSLVETLKAVAALEPALTGLQLPVKGAFSLNTILKLDGPAKIALTDLQAAIGSLNIKGRVSADLGGARPNVDATLQMATLNLDDLLPKNDTGAASGRARIDDGRVFPADPLPLEGLKAADANVKLTIDKVIIDGMEIANLKVNLALENGRLNLDLVNAGVADGKINGSVVLDGSKNIARLKARIEASQIDYGKLLSERGLTDMASGKVDLMVDVSGNGGSVRQLMAGLNGRTRVVTENGRLESGALNIVSTDMLNMFDSKDDKTIRCAVIQFNITRGIANVHAIVFETGGISVVGTGSANLANETLNLRVDPRSKKANLATVAMVPVDIIGTFLEPDWRIDMAGAAGNVAASAARTAGAIATMGLSLLVEKVAKETVIKTDETDYCTPALAGKKVVPEKLAAAKQPAAQSSEPAPPAVTKKKKSADPLEAIGSGVASGLKNLFGD